MKLISPKRVVALLIVIACVICQASVAISAANTSVTEVKGVTAQNVKTGQYLNFDYGTLKNGTPLRVWPWDGSKEQLFDIDKVSGDTYRILTNASSKYCVDVYRGNAKLKAGQLCDIWKTGDDTTAQNLKFYLCDDGSYILRMAADENLAISSNGSKAQLKLAKFSASDEAQKWVFKDENGEKIDIRLSETTSSTVTTEVTTVPVEVPEEITASTDAPQETTVTEEIVTEPEPLKFKKPLSSSYTTNVVTQSWANYYGGYHLGVDLGTYGNKSTKVNVIADGEIYRIVKESKSGGWGNIVIVKHKMADGKVFYSGYAHLSSFADIKEGDFVKVGTKLGMMGSTGFSTGPHLHLLVFTGSFSKKQLPAGYANKKISGNSYKYKGLTYYDPMKVISTAGSIIK